MENKTERDKTEREDGFNAGCRRIGMLGLAMIPWALGAGAMMWLGVYVYDHQIARELSQEDRAATYVGAKERPKEKIRIIVESKGCAIIDQATLDGETLSGYFVNQCNMPICYVEIHHKLKSSDATVISSGEKYVFDAAGLNVLPKERVEFSERVRSDDRAASIALILSYESSICHYTN